METRERPQLTPAWVARLPLASAPALARFRGDSDLRVTQIDAVVWLAGSSWDEDRARRFRGVPGGHCFHVLSDGQLVEMGNRLPTDHLPDAVWEPLDGWLRIELPSAHWGARVSRTASLRMVRGGATLVFREELREVLTVLAPEGLPPLSAVLLLLAATRGNWLEVTREAERTAALVAGAGATADEVRQMGQLFGQLDRVRLLDEPDRVPLEAKQALAGLVFEKSQRRGDPVSARRVLELLEYPVLPGQFDSQRGDDAREPSGHGDDLKCLLPGLGAVESARIRLRIDTGLDQLPSAAQLELPVPRQVRMLLEQLRDDSEWSSLAAAARRLMAAVTLPRPSHTSDDPPTGGFADIANRGPLDRLLLSELAHDDLTLAARVALREALYMRREAPPEPRPRSRCVLLETGVRSWGVPRLFVAAAGLAIAATSDPGGEVHVFRTADGTAQPVDLTSRPGLAHYLGELSVDTHPGAALTALASRPNWANPSELVVVGMHESFADPEFRQAVRELARPLLLVSLSRDGRLQVLESFERRTRLLREARLNLDSITPHVPSPLVRHSADRLPAIFRACPFPFRLSHHVETANCRLVKGFGVLATTRDRRLMRWTERGRGAIQIADSLPDPDVLWWKPVPYDPGQTAIVGSPADSRLFVVRLQLGQNSVEAYPLVTRGHSYQHVGMIDATVFAITQEQHVHLFASNSGRRISELRPPSQLCWAGQRFFADEGRSRWYALAVRGGAARLEEIPLGKISRSPRIQLLIDCDAAAGPVALRDNRELYFTAEDCCRPSGLPQSKNLRVADTAVDGHWIAFEEPGRPLLVHWLLDVPAARSQRRAGNWGLVKAKEVERYVRTMTRLPVPEQLGVSHDHLALVADGLAFVLTFDEPSRAMHIRCCGLSRNLNLRSVRRFEPVSLGTDAMAPGWTLEMAQWPGGSRAWIDSRGLLHLCSGRGNAPEISLTLVHGEIGAWSSDGRRWGNPYFFGDESSSLGHLGSLRQDVHKFLWQLPPT